MFVGDSYICHLNGCYAQTSWDPPKTISNEDTIFILFVSFVSSLWNLVMFSVCNFSTVQNKFSSSWWTTFDYHLGNHYMVWVPHAIIQFLIDCESCWQK